MCGIAGFYRFPDAPTTPPARLEAMVRLLRHRGPDAEGAHRAGPFGLGHARLSILDLATGDQPLYSEDRQVAVICNGEVYNFAELRRELEGRGHGFASRSDSEVIVHLYEELGDACVEKLRGMFAFALADFRRQRLLLARDRLGKKPLYVAEAAGHLVFASELKSLVQTGWIDRDVDRESLDLYLTFGYVPAPWTIYRQARKLPAGFLATCDQRGFATRRYWDVAFAAEERPEGELVAELEELLDEAVRIRLASDVPLGAFLSGGLDSGTVVSFMAPALDGPVLTHTVGFDDPALDEREDAAAVARALATDHVEMVVRPHLTEVLPRIAWHLDEPFADPSAVPTWYVSRETRRRVTVALSGDGGDELFAGYTWRYGLHLLEERVRPLVPGALRRRALPALARLWPRSPRLPRALRAGNFLANVALDAPRSYLRDHSMIPPGLQEELFGEELRERGRRFDVFSALEPHLRRAPQDDPLGRALYLDLKTWLADDILVKVDRMSMAHSLEVRSPLLDQQIVEFAARVPSALKFRRGRGKLLLRSIAARRLPPALLRRPKRGFAPPVSRWLRQDLQDLARDLLLDPSALAAALFRRAPLERLLARHQRREVDAGAAIWTLVMLEGWWQWAATAATAARDEPVHRRAEARDALSA